MSVGDRKQSMANKSRTLLKDVALATHVILVDRMVALLMVSQVYNQNNCYTMAYFGPD